MRVLLIGGTKFIGPYVVKQLADLGHEVSVFHRGETNYSFSTDVNQIYGDRKQLGEFRSQFQSLKPDVVIDMIPFYEEDTKLFVQVFKGVAERVIAVSSQDVYRPWARVHRKISTPIESNILTETSPLRDTLYVFRDPKTPPTEEFSYNYEKVLVEGIIMNSPEIVGTILRLPMVYGPGDRNHRMFPYIKRMSDNRPVIFMEQSFAQWKWTKGYVENVAHAITLATTNPRSAEGIYNVGEEETLTMSQWVRLIGNTLNWNGEIMDLPNNELPGYLQESENFQQNMESSSEKIRVELGYKEIVSSDEAILRTIEWERFNPPEHTTDEFNYHIEDELALKN